MKKVFLMGRSEAGKTSLTQALKGEELHYHKTQYTNSNEDTIDSPGEYAESKHFSVGLACFSFEADVIAIVQAANEPFNLFSDGSRNFLLRPLIGIITKVDSPYANLPMVRQWMENMGCERIFEVNNVTHARAGKVQAEPWTERMAATPGGRGVSGEHSVINARVVYIIKKDKLLMKRHAEMCASFFDTKNRDYSSQNP